ncbi:YbaB/EbfC family nucleoid-associated protein [Candidatus Collierbacteria bacterium]|nr:YbaB/EbfC family nucleoid-associated protein [Candidatus Collierbacteria bacterium]
MFGKIGQIGSQGAAVARLAILQRKILKKKIELEEDGVKVVVTGDGKVKHMEIDGNDASKVVRVVNEAISKAQKYAASEMQGSMGDLGKLLGK